MIICNFAVAACAETLTISGALDVLDGDTLAIGPVQVRLYGIDAPETGQYCALPDGSEWNCGRFSMRFLDELARAGDLDCLPLSRDPYGRIIATCSANGVDLSGAMVDAGLAWAFVEYSDFYVARETIARAAEIGIFQADTQTAKAYRDDAWQRAVEAAPDGCPIKGNINGETRIYHTPWSPNYSQTKIDGHKGERWFCNEAEALGAGWVPRR